MKWKLNNQKQTVSLTNLDVIRGDDDTPIAYVGDRQHSELLRSAPELEIERNELRGAMARLCRAVSRRMMPDEPTPEDRLELMEAYEQAVSIIERNN